MSATNLLFAFLINMDDKNIATCKSSMRFKTPTYPRLLSKQRRDRSRVCLLIGAKKEEEKNRKKKEDSCVHIRNSPYPVAERPFQGSARGLHGVGRSCGLQSSGRKCLRPMVERLDGTDSWRCRTRWPNPLPPLVRVSPILETVRSSRLVCHEKQLALFNKIRSRSIFFFCSCLASSSPIANWTVSAFCVHVSHTFGCPSTLAALCFTVEAFGFNPDVNFLAFLSCLFLYFQSIPFKFTDPLSNVWGTHTRYCPPVKLVCGTRLFHMGLGF